MTRSRPLLDLIHPRSRSSLWALISIYSRLLERIEGSNYDVFRRRVRLSPVRKVAGSWCARWSAGQPNSGPAIAKTRSGTPGNGLLPRYMRMKGRSATKPADSSHCTQSAL